MEMVVFNYQFSANHSSSLLISTSLNQHFITSLFSFDFPFNTVQRLLFYIYF